jgi:hypothetical protein
MLKLEETMFLTGEEARIRKSITGMRDLSTQRVKPLHEEKEKEDWALSQTPWHVL